MSLCRVVRQKTIKYWTGETAKISSHCGQVHLMSNYVFCFTFFYETINQSFLLWKTASPLFLQQATFYNN